MKTLLKLLLLLVVLIAALAGIVAFGLSREIREPPLSGTAQRGQLKVGSLQRSFLFYSPKQTAASKQAAHLPLLFILHGSNANGVFMRKTSLYRFDELADREGVIVVYPDGYRKFWNDCRKSADYAANQKNIDDPAFFSAMIDYFVTKYGADPDRVYALGVSNGGHMVYRLGLELPDKFAALAAVAANLPVDSNLDCTQSGQPVSIAILNGTQDPINPFNGGVVNIFGNSSRGAVRSASDTTAYWAGLAGAQLVEAQQLPDVDGDPATSIRRDIYRGPQGVEVRLYTLQGSGHVLPAQLPFFLRQASKLLLGEAAGDMESSVELWDFFNTHTLARGAD